MRLICADALETKAKTIYMEHGNVAIPTRVIPISDLHLAPTIDAEPVRHGRWVPKKVGAVTTEFECSECGRTVTLTNDYFGKATKYASSYYPYCHCGAKMRGDKDADE